MVMVTVRRDLMEVVMIKISLKLWKETFCRKIQMFTGTYLKNNIDTSTCKIKEDLVPDI